jgi:hypothetical protein
MPLSLRVSRLPATRDTRNLAALCREDRRERAKLYPACEPARPDGPVVIISGVPTPTRVLPSAKNAASHPKASSDQPASVPRKVKSACPKPGGSREVTM